MFWISDSAPVASRAHSSVCACVVPLFCCSFILVTKLPVEQTKIIRSLGVPSTFWWPLGLGELDDTCSCVGSGGACHCDVHRGLTPLQDIQLVGEGIRGEERSKCDTYWRSV